MGITDETVSFRYHDYRDGQQKVMTLAGDEFLRRFLQHVLPAGFMRIRHYGWLANASRAKALPLVRAAIAADTPTAPTVAAQPLEAIAHFDGIPCPCCKTGTMRVRYPLPPQRLEYG